MKTEMKLISIAAAIIFMFLLTGCNSAKQESKQSPKETDVTENTNSSNEDDGNEEDKTNDGVDSEDGSMDESELNDEGDFPPDQTNLKIGEKAEIMSMVNHYEITLKSVELLDELNGETPDLDFYFRAVVSVKNLSDKELHLADVADVLQISDSKEGSGSSDVSAKYGYDDFDKILQPGETGEATMISQTYKSKEQYYLFLGKGLNSEGAGVMNLASWAFNESDVK
ncbi:hypothetical protein [Bacillus kwashiorkori]|uniref:hypothetical protein n=1 Tax=Bacillus kwashiorkori TaxID=1522318 RepID=UPI000783B36D|nr:hypothetical protein [Bacillus kwashiorkori]